MTANSFQLRSILTENDDGNFNLGFVKFSSFTDLIWYRGCVRTVSLYPRSHLTLLDHLYLELNFCSFFRFEQLLRCVVL